MSKRFTVDCDGRWWDKIKHEYVTLDSLFRLVEELDYTINEMAKTIRIYDDGYIDLNKKYKKLADENEQLKSDKEHLMGYLIRFCRFDSENIDYVLNYESNREYGKQYYSMKEETKKELEE